MATITVTRSLPSLVGVFNVNTFEFTITEDVIPTVTIAGVAFSPVKTGTGSGVDTYVMDVTDILKYVIGLPLLTTPTVSGITGEVDGVSESCTIAISGTGATTVNITRTLIFSVDKIGTETTLDIYNLGRNEIVYHYGDIMFYNKSAVTGNTVCSIGGIDYTYLIAAGWNLISLDTTQKISGIFTVAGTDISVRLIYIDTPASTESIEWINRDGCWSKTYLRKLSESYSIENSNIIPIYNSIHSAIVSMNRSISANKTVSLNYDIVAKSTDHYRILCEMADSPVILVNTKILARITNISKDIAECRQNLHFVLTLQYQDYVANY